ncbi:MAG: DUF2339 domain-containing protein [Planctomycetota bacterium]
MDPHLEQRLARIEERLDALEEVKTAASPLRLLTPAKPHLPAADLVAKVAAKAPPSAKKQTPPVVDDEITVRKAPVRDTPTPRRSAHKPQPDRAALDWERFLGVAVLGRIGVGAVLLAAAYFARMWYDASAPLGRVLMLHGAGALFFVAGWWARRRTIARYVGLLWGAGTAILWLAAAAAHLRFGLVGPEVAMAMVLATSALATWHAHVLDSEWLASAALGGAFGAVYLLPSASDPRTFLTAYALVLLAWSQMLDLKRGWVAARAVGSVGVLILTASWALTGARWDASMWWHLQAVAVALAAPELVSLVAGGRLSRERGAAAATIVLVAQGVLALVDIVHGRVPGVGTDGFLMLVGAAALGLAVARTRQARSGSIYLALALGGLASFLLPVGGSVWALRLEAAAATQCHVVLSLMAAFAVVLVGTTHWTRRGEAGAAGAGALALLWLFLTPRGDQLATALADFALALFPGALLLARARRPFWAGAGVVLFGAAAALEPVLLATSSPWAAPWAYGLAAAGTLLLPLMARPGRSARLQAMPAALPPVFATSWIATLVLMPRAADALPILEPVTVSALVIALTGAIVHWRGVRATQPGTTERSLASVAGVVAVLVLVVAGHREIDAATATWQAAHAALARLGWYGLAMLVLAARGRRTRAPWVAGIVAALGIVATVHVGLVASCPWTLSETLPAFLAAAAIPLVAELLLPRTRRARLTRASLVILTAGVWVVTGINELEQGALLFNPRLLSGLAVVAALLIGAWVDGRGRTTGNERAYQAGIALPLGWYVGLGEVLHVVETLDPAWRAVAVSLYTTAWAAVLLLAGFRWRLPVLRYLALGTFGAVILKVGFYDLRTTPLPLRVLVTGVLGVVLLVAAYGYARRKEEARAG